MKMYSNFSLATVISALSASAIFLACSGSNNIPSSAQDAFPAVLTAFPSPDQLAARQDLNRIPMGIYRLSWLTTYRQEAATDQADYGFVLKLNTPGFAGSADRSRADAVNVKSLTGRPVIRNREDMILPMTLVARGGITERRDLNYFYDEFERRQNADVVRSNFKPSQNGIEGIADHILFDLLPDRNMFYTISGIPSPGMFFVGDYNATGVVLLEGDRVRIIIETYSNDGSGQPRFHRVIQLVYKRIG